MPLPVNPSRRRLGTLFNANAEAGERLTGAIMGKGGGGFKGQAMLDFLRHPPLVSCIESLVGPEIVGSSVYRVRPKAPGYTRGAVPWHQDSGYFLSHCDKSLIVTCWIPLVDATIDNGCIVLPKSHHNGVVRHYTGGQGDYLEIAQEDLPARTPVAVEMGAGSVLFMTNLTPHASFENKTDIVRWSVDLRYQDPEVPHNIDERPRGLHTRTRPCHHGLPPRRRRLRHQRHAKSRTRSHRYCPISRNPRPLRAHTRAFPRSRLDPACRALGLRSLLET